MDKSPNVWDFEVMHNAEGVVGWTGNAETVYTGNI